MGDNTYFVILFFVRIVRIHRIFSHLSLEDKTILCENCDEEYKYEYR